MDVGVPWRQTLIFANDEHESKIMEEEDGEADVEHRPECLVSSTIDNQAHDSIH